MKKLILLLLAFPFFCSGQDNIYSVTSPNGLNMRDKPGTDGNKIATLLLGDFVNIKEKTEKSLTINDFNKTTGKTEEISGHWVKIKTLSPPKLKGNKILWEDNYENVEGYVFDGFLKKIELNDTISSTDLVKENNVFYYNKKRYTGRTLSGKNPKEDFVTIETYLNGIRYRINKFYNYWTNPFIIMDNIYYKNGNIMAEGQDKDCSIWDYTYFYENGVKKSENTDGCVYCGRHEHTQWYDNGKLKFGFGKSNEKISILRGGMIGDLKIKTFDFNEENIKKYGLNRITLNIPKKTWYYRNGKEAKTVKFIDYISLEDYGEMGSEFFIEINGIANKISPDEFGNINPFLNPYIINAECWDENGIKINCSK